MGKLAFLFAGQGAQQPGMGKDLYALGGQAAQVFKLAEQRRPGTMADCFEADAARLAQTEVTQPCVFAVDLAAACALAERGLQPDGVAGFSLGEMAALAFAGAFDMETGFDLVARRGALMQQAAKEAPGSMAAVLKLPDATVEELCARYRQVYPVNYNCDGQLVVAGAAAEMPDLCAAVKTAGGMARPLAVSGAFHSPFMRHAAEHFLLQLRQADMQTPKLPVYANLTAAPYGADPAQTLAGQMKSPVRWKETIARMVADGYDTFVEVGPGATLTGLGKRIAPDARRLNVQDAESLAAAVEALGAH